MNKSGANIAFQVLLLLSQIVAIIFYGIFHDAVPTTTTAPPPASVSTAALGYPYFQDIHIMVFVGMAFLFAFLSKFRLGAIVQCFWVAAISVQYYILWSHLWSAAWKAAGKFYIFNSGLIKAEFCAMAMVVIAGSVLGKVNNIQLLLVVMLGVIVYTINEAILFFSLDVSDIGGSIYIFLFAGMFGLGLTAIVNYAEARRSLNYVSKTNSSTFAMLGTLFLWCFWPSFNSALAWGNTFDSGVISFTTSASPSIIANLAVVNTYFCLIGSVLGAVFTSCAFRGGKIDMEHILVSSLFGGILMGAGADMLYDSFVAYLIGGIGGILSVLSCIGLKALFLKLRIHDTNSTFHLFALAGANAAWLSAIFRARYIPAQRGGIQIAGMGIAAGIGIVGGLIVGVITRFFGSYETENEYYNDESIIHFDEATALDQNAEWKSYRLLLGRRVSPVIMNQAYPSKEQMVFQHDVIQNHHHDMVLATHEPVAAEVEGPINDVNDDENDLRV